MAKTKTPYFSMGARGTLAGSITAQKRGSATIVRQKPLPAYRYSLAQAYQRWLYEDYAYLWTLQTAAIRQEYATAGVRFHLTGFQYWMKAWLTKKTDISAWYRLDSTPGATIPDYSAYKQPATVIGASSAPGAIGKSLYFDGLNDYLRSPLAVTTRLGTDYSFELLVKSTDPATFEDIAGWQVGAPWAAARLLLYQRFNWYSLSYSNGVIFRNGKQIIPTSTDWQHIYIEVEGNTIRAYGNGILKYSATEAWAPLISGIQFRIGGGIRGAIYYWDGYADNPITYTGLLDTTLIPEHSARRYPPQ